VAGAPAPRARQTPRMCTKLEEEEEEEKEKEK